MFVCAMLKEEFSYVHQHLDVCTFLLRALRESRQPAAMKFSSIAHLNTNSAVLPEQPTSYSYPVNLVCRQALSHLMNNVMSDLMYIQHTCLCFHCKHLATYGCATDPLGLTFLVAALPFAIALTKSSL